MGTTPDQASSSTASSLSNMCRETPLARPYTHVDHQNLSRTTVRPAFNDGRICD